jgi:hypothetical protein
MPTTAHGRSSQIVSPTPTVKYIPPNRGSVFLKVIESYDISNDKDEGASPLTDSQVCITSLI